MMGIFRALSRLGNFFLGAKDDIPVFEERPYPSIYNRLIYLTEKYPDREDLQAYCQEVKEMIELLKTKNKLEAGAFINFCQRIFHEEIDLYEVESMLGEINNPEHSMLKDTINRKAFEKTVFFLRLEERLARLIPDLHTPIRVTSVIEKISKLENSEAHSREFCSEMTELLIRLNDNEKLPKEDIEAFLLTYVPDSYHYHNMGILLNSPDDPTLRVLDGFPRIIFIRHVFSEIISAGMPMRPQHKKETLPTSIADTDESETVEETVESIRGYLIGHNETRALEKLIKLCAVNPAWEKEAEKMKRANESLIEQNQMGLISHSKDTKLRWLWTSWALDLLERLENHRKQEVESDIQDQGNT